MVARLSPLFELAPIALGVVTFFGATTAFFAATVGLVQNDIKRVVAYSTCSQLGYMFVAEGVGNYGAGMFHLFTHAFFKALLFLGAGAVIHALHHEQDMRRMGALRKVLPFTWAMMLIGTLSLTGFPFTSGFASKDAIIEAAYAAGTPIGMYGFVLTAIAALLTSFYSWRLMFLTFEGKPREKPDVLAHAHEPPWTMGLPLILLALGSLLAGAVFMRFFIGSDQTDFWRGSLVTHGEAHHEVPILVMLAPTLAMAAGFAVAWYFYITNPLVPFGLAKCFRGLYQFLLHAWYLTTCTTPSSCGRRRNLGASCGRWATAPSSMASALTAWRARDRHHQPRRQAAERLHLSLCLRHADRRGADHHLFHLCRGGLPR
jgi:NADH-quinone oxidoreductase subunit L